MAETTDKKSIGSYKKRVIRNLVIVCAIYGGLLLLKKIFVRI